MREDAELRSWLEWLAESTNERSSAMGRWYLAQLDNGCGLEDAAFLDLQIQEHPGGTSTAAGLVVFQHAEKELYQRLVEAARNRLAELELEYDSTASALEGKRELNEDETSRLKQLWKKLVRMFHPDLHEQEPEKRKTYELLTQAINEARDHGDIELLERIAKDPQAFILQQGWASISLDAERGLKELRSLYEHLQARILEMIETLDELRASPEMEIFREVEQDEQVMDRIAAAQREELEQEIAVLEKEARVREEEIEELVGSSPL